MQIKRLPIVRNPCFCVFIRFQGSTKMGNKRIVSNSSCLVTFFIRDSRIQNIRGIAPCRDVVTSSFVPALNQEFVDSDRLLVLVDAIRGRWMRERKMAIDLIGQWLSSIFYTLPIIKKDRI